MWCKRALFARVQAAYLAEVIDPQLAPLSLPGAGLASLIRYFENLGQFMREAPAEVANRGCLLLNTATELAVLDEEAAVLVESYRQRMAAVFRAVLAQAARDGDLDSVEGTQARRVDLLVAQVIGLFVTSRLSPPAAAALAATISAEIRTWKPRSVS